MTKKLTIATRKSPLALRQSEMVRDRLGAAHPGLQVELLPLSTRGDEVLDRSLAAIGGKGLFIKELEIALAEGRADIAVHSMKDVPAEMPAGFSIGAVLARADPRDALVSPRLAGLDALRPGHRVGTSSLRRQAQLLERFPGIEVVPLRGNVGTRLGKLDAGEFDAAILAAAGLDRLGLTDRIRGRVGPDLILPAVGQGAIGIEIRAGDAQTLNLLHPLHDDATAHCIAAERAMSEQLGGSCQLPLAGHATVVGDQLHLRALISRPDGSEVVRAEQYGVMDAAETLGRAVAGQLLARGGAAILAALQP